MKLFYVEDKYILFYRIIIVVALSLTLLASILGGLYGSVKWSGMLSSVNQVEKKDNDFKNPQTDDFLEKYKEIFNGKLGKWKDTYYDIELQPGVSPYHARAFPIPRVHERALRVEVERLIKEGVLKEINRSEWAAPTFIIPKKDGTVRFNSDFRELNKRIKRKKETQRTKTNRLPHLDILSVFHH